MLVLTRKIGEEIVIGGDIRVTVVEMANGRVKLGVTAPKSVRVDRAEVHEQREQADAPLSSAVPVNRFANDEVMPVVAEGGRASGASGPDSGPIPAPAATPVQTGSRLPVSHRPFKRKSR